MTAKNDVPTGDSVQYEVTLACGCSLDWWDHDPPRGAPQVGWWFTCNLHSQHVGGYDPDDGSPNLDRDQRVTKVTPTNGSQP